MKEMFCINPEKQVIACNVSKQKRKSAEERHTYYHFCSLENLQKILNSKAIKFNNIENFTGYAEYERKNIMQEFWNLVFIACFTSKLDSDDMWEDFGDHNKGACIEFRCPEIFHRDVLDSNRLVEAFNIEKEMIGKFGFNKSSVLKSNMCCKPNVFTQPIVDVILTDINYYTQEPKDNVVSIGDNNALNLSTVSSYVPIKLADENETRMIGILRSTHEILMEKIAYLLVPIKLKDIKLHFGKKVNEKDQQYYFNLLQQLQDKEKMRGMD